MNDFAALLPLLRRERRAMAWTFLVAVLSVVTLAAIAALSAAAVGRAVVDGVGPPPALWAALSGLVLLRALLTWHEMDVSHSLAYRILHRLRMALFDGAAVQLDRDHSARRTSVVMTDTERLEFFYAHTIAQLAASAVGAAVAVTATAVLSPAAAFAATIGVVVVAISSRWGRKMAKDAGWQRARRVDVLTTTVSDALAGRREVIVFRLGEQLRVQVRALTDRVGRIDLRLARLHAWIQGGREFLVTVTVAGTVVALAIEASVDPAMAPAIVVLALAGVTSADAAATTIVQVNPLAASARRVAAGSRTDLAVTGIDSIGAADIPPGPLGVRWTNVDVDYAGVSVLGGHTATVGAGEHVAVTGPSGSGKSTLLAVLARLTPTCGGDIELVGALNGPVSLKTLDESQLRSTVAVVSQEPILFHGTVRMNLSLGAGDLSDMELQQALELVGADTFTTLDAIVGEQGVGLSGGQIARIALARALVARPRILLIDELTAALDERAEAQILDAVDRFDGTVLCVSHRRSTIARFARVITLGDSSVAALSES